MAEAIEPKTPTSENEASAMMIPCQMLGGGCGKTQARRQDSGYGHRIHVQAWCCAACHATICKIQFRKDENA